MRGSKVKLEAFLFDLDGTLIHSKIDFRSMKKALVNYFVRKGVPMNFFTLEEVTYEIITKGMNYLKQKREIETQHIKEEINSLMNRYEMEGLTSVKSIEGVKEVLAHLKKEGFKIGVVTRACREYAVKALEKTGLIDYVDEIVARNDVETPKPSREPILTILKKLGVKKAVFIGDHPLDLKCAESAGIPFIAVSTGYATRKELKKSGCTLILKDMTQLEILPFFKEK